MSTSNESQIDSIFRALNKSLLLFNSSLEIPVTCAPKELRIKLSQEPLKPLWPVTKTFLSFQN